MTYLRWFRRRSLQELMLVELAEAEMSKLKAQSALEYATAIVEYETKRIKRLRALTSGARA